MTWLILPFRCFTVSPSFSFSLKNRYRNEVFGQICLGKQCRPRSDCSYRSSLIRVYTVCHSVCIIWTHYSMVEPHSSNFRVITTNFLGVRIFRKFTVHVLHGSKERTKFYKLWVSKDRVKSESFQTFQVSWGIIEKLANLAIVKHWVHVLLQKSEGQQVPTEILYQIKIYQYSLFSLTLPKLMVFEFNSKDIFKCYFKYL